MDRCFPTACAALLLVIVAAFLIGPAAAQDAPAPGPAPGPAPEGTLRPVLDLQTLPATLLMDLEEMIAVESAIAAGPLARRPRDLGPESPADRFRLATNLYVSGIIYLGPWDWTVWINGRPVRPDTTAASELFEVIEVSPRTVRLAVPWGEGGTRDVVLNSHQTFVPRRGVVVEGRR